MRHVPFLGSGIEPVIPLAQMSMGRVVEFLEWLVAGHNPRDTPSCLGISATCSSKKRTRMAHRATDATGTGTPTCQNITCLGD